MHWIQAATWFAAGLSGAVADRLLMQIRKNRDDDPNGDAPTLEREKRAGDEERRREALRRVLTEDWE